MRGRSDKYTQYKTLWRDATRRGSNDLKIKNGHSETASVPCTNSAYEVLESSTDSQKASPGKVKPKRRRRKRKSKSKEVDLSEKDSIIGDSNLNHTDFDGEAPGSCIMPPKNKAVLVVNIFLFVTGLVIFTSLAVQYYTFSTS